MTTPLEAAARRRRDLASAVRRLRVAVMTDPGRSGEFADTLVELVGNRVLAWSFAEAAADAPESVVLSARILAEHGPMGPYTSAEDAVRYFTASVQLAAVQAGLGQAEAAGRTLDALDAWRAQLGRLPLAERLTPVSVTWALAVRARAAQQAAVANGYADAALLRLYAAGLDLDAAAAYLAVTVHLAAADARWEAGRPEAALAHHRLALTRYLAAVAELDGGTRPALVQVASAPLADLYGPFALRLEAVGDQAGGLAVLREWVASAERIAAPDAAAQLARAALGSALTRAGRGIEAEFAPVASATGVSMPAPGARIDWPPLPPEQVLSASGLTVTASVRLQRDEQAAIAENAAARAAAQLAEARLRAQAEARAEAARRAEARAAVAAREAADRARTEAQAAAEHRAAQEAAEQAAAAERRRERAAAREDARAVDPELVLTSAAELPVARQQVVQAGVEPALLAAAHERLAALLRPLATADPDRYRDELVATLEALVSLRWRLGDPEGSREAARERKAW